MPDTAGFKLLAKFGERGKGKGPIGVVWHQNHYEALEPEDVAFVL